jgi:chromosome segregation protein
LEETKESRRNKENFINIKSKLELEIEDLNKKLEEKKNDLKKNEKLINDSQNEIKDCERKFLKELNRIKREEKEINNKLDSYERKKNDNILEFEKFDKINSNLSIEKKKQKNIKLYIKNESNNFSNYVSLFEFQNDKVFIFKMNKISFYDSQKNDKNDLKKIQKNLFSLKYELNNSNSEISEINQKLEIINNNISSIDIEINKNEELKQIAVNNRNFKEASNYANQKKSLVSSKSNLIITQEKLNSDIVNIQSNLIVKKKEEEKIEKKLKSFEKNINLDMLKFLIKNRY